MNPDVIIIGAGAAGMMAALKLAEKGKKVMVLEALRRTGGRMFTVEDTATGQAVEMGAEFVHGDLSITKELLEEAGAQLYKITGHIWQFRNGALEQDDANEDFDSLLPALKSLDQDLPVATFIEQHVKNNQPEELTFSLRGYIEGYYAADTERSSSFALRDELDREEEPQYRIEGGYRLLVQHLEAQCRKNGVQFFLEEKVNQVLWQEGQVTVITGKGQYNAPKALITVSVGVLQSDAIAFEPQLPEHKAAAQALGFGHVVKISLLFKQPFWKEPRLTRGKDLHDIQFMFSEEAVPTWWSQHPKEDNLFTGWLAGPKAVALKNDSHEALLQKALDSLSHIFGLEPAYLWQDLLGAWSHNWSDDPHFNGAYSYEVVNGAAHQQVLLRPVANTLYFAGEGLHHGPEIGTVEAALISGKEAAELIMEGR